MLSLIETFILFSSKEHFVVYSSGIFMVLTVGVGLLRLIYIDLRIYKYLKNNHPEIYTKLSTNIFSIKLIPRSALNFSFVIESLDDASILYYKEYKILVKYLGYSFILFGIFSFIIVLLARPL